MLKNKIVKDDGRYLIFYIFEDAPSDQQPATDTDKQSESRLDQDQPTGNDD